MGARQHTPTQAVNGWHRTNSLLDSGYQPACTEGDRGQNTDTFMAQTNGSVQIGAVNEPTNNHALATYAIKHGAFMGDA
jgi:hypothetical protein